MNMLGDTLEKIAFEKAGIIKPGIPVVVGEVKPETRPVFERRAAEDQAPLFIATEHYFVTDWHSEPHRLSITVADKKTDNRNTYHLDLQGVYQLKNLLTVLESVRQLNQNGWEISEAAMQKGLAKAKKLTGLHGRWDIIHQHPAIVLDVAHNEDGIRQLVEQIEITDHNNLHIVIGMVKDKEVERALSLLPKHASYYFTKARIPRALPEEQLAEKAAAQGLNGKHYPDVNTALKDALAHAGKNDLILICGSVFVVGEVNLEALAAYSA